MRFASKALVLASAYCYYPPGLRVRVPHTLAADSVFRDEKKIKTSSAMIGLDDRLIVIVVRRQLHLHLSECPTRLRYIDDMFHGPRLHSTSATLKTYNTEKSTEQTARDDQNTANMKTEGDEKEQIRLGED